jgi:hypothetical protein
MPQLLQLCLPSFFICNVQVFGTWNGPLERCFQDLSNDILQAPKFLKFACLVIVEHDCQKNRNGEMTVVFFCNVFYECIERKSGICLSIGDVYWR